MENNSSSENTLHVHCGCTCIHGVLVVGINGGHARLDNTKKGRKLKGVNVVSGARKVKYYCFQGFRHVQKSKKVPEPQNLADKQN